LGLNHKKYSPAIKMVGTLYCILVPSLFAAMPLYIHFSSY
jgi:succinate dehydrogenase / fumarate reductase cytochrome b subunit